jgi:hypothetical protein
MNLNPNTALSKYRVLIFAIFLSFVLHLFWLSAVRVVAAPQGPRPVKFSRVSFLGPLLTKTATEVRITQRPRSFLEERYNALAGDPLDKETGTGLNAPVRYDNARGSRPNFDKKIALLVDSAVSGRKLEPAF